jgi:hypothetical protein
MARTNVKSAPQPLPQEANQPAVGPVVEAPAAIAQTLQNVLGETTLQQRRDPVDLPRQPSNARSRGPLIDSKNIFTRVTEERQSELEMRSELVKATSQVLAHASDLYAEGDDKAKEAKGIADKAAIQLYQGRAAGILTAEQVSDVLKNAFGAQKKGARTVKVHPSDPEASKTPFGAGEDIRKRVVRAANAFDHINGRIEDRFFEGLDRDSADEDGNTLGDVLDRLSDGSIGLWASYERMAAIKRAHQVRTNPAFDAKKMAAIVNALGEEGARSIILGNPGLKIVYAELIEVLSVIGEEEPEEA